MPHLFEMHLHTDESSPCGKVPARRLVEMYAKRGYAGIVVTDHFYTGFFERQEHRTWPEKIERFYEGYRLAEEAGRRHGLVVIPGMEFTFPGTYDDILVYGAEIEWVARQTDMHRLGPAGLTRIARENNLLLIQAHPYRNYVSRLYDEVVEGVEVVNGNPRQVNNNPRARLAAEKHGYISIAGSDFHQPEDAGLCGTWLPEMPGTTTELAAILRRHRTFELFVDGSVPA